MQLNKLRQNKKENIKQIKYIYGIIKKGKNYITFMIQNIITEKEIKNINTLLKKVENDTIKTEFKYQTRLLPEIFTLSNKKLITFEKYNLKLQELFNNHRL